MVLIGGGDTAPRVEPPEPAVAEPPEPAVAEPPEPAVAEPPGPAPGPQVQPGGPVGQGDSAAAVSAPAPQRPAAEGVTAPPADAARGARLRRRAVVAAIAIVVVIGAGAGAIVLGRHSGAHKPVAHQAAATTPANFVTYRDPADGFTISYPRTWSRVTPPANGLALLLNVGGQDAVSVRVIGLQSPVQTAKQLAAVKSVTDGILGEAGQIQVLHQQSFTLNGMPGYYYLYTFPGTNGASGGVHAQYFVFQGRAMNELVFQAVPPSDFAHLAPVFDQVANTFHSTPGFAPPAPAASTTVPTTTASTAAP